jgi:hypothetical protein
VDGLTCRDYEPHLERNLEDLHARVHRGAYRALPSRRVHIPKPDGRQRPIAVAALEDKIVQRATAAVLSAIYHGRLCSFLAPTHINQPAARVQDARRGPSRPVSHTEHLPFLPNATPDGLSSPPALRPFLVLELAQRECVP